MSCACGCGGVGDCSCGGGQDALQTSINRPGLNSIAVRLGDHAAFVKDAWRRLASSNELSRLGSREGNDATAALVDAWAVAADVLTFYNERLANEGYLRTAREEFSVSELAELVGYRPRPGIAASVPLAFLLDPKAAPVEIPAGARAQTVPGPGETLQNFETAEPLLARAEWSEMRPRLTRPSRITFYDALVRDRLWLSDASLIIHPGEKILFVFDRKHFGQVVREVATATPDITNGRQLLCLKPIPNLTLQSAEQLLKRVKGAAFNEEERKRAQALFEAVESFLLGGSLVELEIVLKASYPEAAIAGDAVFAIAREMAKVASKIVKHRPEPAPDIIGTSTPQQLYASLERTPARQPRTARDMQQSVQALLKDGTDGPLQLTAATSPALGQQLYSAWSHMPAAEQAGELESVHILRTTAGAFGGNVPPVVNKQVEEFALTYPQRAPEDDRALHLDAIYDGIQSGSYVVLRAPVRAAGYPPKENDDG